MKNSTHYRLRALACALLASAAMLGACDDDDPNDDPDPGKKPPVTLTDQIQYDGGDLVGIKSAIYVAEEDGSHTFYLSPTEGLINAEQMKQADDYLRVMVESPKGTVNTASDPFEIEYKDISVKKTTMNDVASVELSADLVTKTRLNLYTYVELKSGKTLIARYQNTCTAERRRTDEPIRDRQSDRRRRKRRRVAQCPRRQPPLLPLRARGPDRSRGGGCGRGDSACRGAVRNGGNRPCDS